jgi:ankyrin repeat protein
LPMWASAGADTGVARLLDAGMPLDARGVDDGTALHYAGLWGRPSTVALLIARGAEVDLIGGPREFPGTALDWTAWGSRALPDAADRLDGYLESARLLVDAGARVTQGMVDKAADDVALVLEEALGAR